MKYIEYNNSWPESYKVSYNYDLMEVFDKCPKKYLGYSYQYNNRKNKTIELISKYLELGNSILDVAAAQGNFTLALAALGYKVTWNDLRVELKDYVKLKYDKGKVEFAPGNIFELGFNSYFDLVLITEIIEHVAHPDDFLFKIAQMVKPGGYIVMTTPNGGYFLNKLPKFSEHPDPSIFESIQFKPNADGHIFLLHADEIKMLADKAGLEIEEVAFFSNFLSNGHVKTSYILPWLPARIVSMGEKITQALPFILKRKIHSGMAVVFKRKS